MSMEEWTGFELSDKVLEEAADWISVLDEIESTECIGFNEIQAEVYEQSNIKREKLASFNRWLGAHPQHQQAYAEMSLLWAKSACIDEISDRLCASNVFSLSPLNQLSQSRRKQDTALSIEDFKNTRLPIIQPYHQDLALNEGNTSASSAWAYTLSICLIVVGLCSPIIQQVF
jgi:hypothetical protein